MANSTHVLEHGSALRSRLGLLPSIRSWLHRLRDAVVEAPHRQVEREVARYLEGTGGKMTDAVEREIYDRFYARARNRLF